MYSKFRNETTTDWLFLTCYVSVNMFLGLYYINKCSLFTFGQKLISAYIRDCIENVLLFISKNTNCYWGMFFPTAKVFTSTKSYRFCRKGFINNSLGITWKFRLIYFKKGEIGCAISQQKNHSELQKFKKGNVADIWLCKKLWLRRPETFENEWQKREHVLKILFHVAGVVNIKLVFMDWFFYY